MRALSRERVCKVLLVVVLTVIVVLPFFCFGLLGNALTFGVILFGLVLMVVRRMNDAENCYIQLNLSPLSLLVRSCEFVLGLGLAPTSHD